MLLSETDHINCSEKEAYHRTDTTIIAYRGMLVGVYLVPSFPCELH